MATFHDIILSWDKNESKSNVELVIKKKQFMNERKIISAMPAPHNEFCCLHRARIVVVVVGADVFLKKKMK